MASLTARSRTVYARENFGQFAARCNAAAVATAEEIAKEGAKESRRMAPVGSKPDKRAGHTKLKRSIKVRTMGTRAEWYSTSKHALPQETGASAHRIIGKVTFFWDNTGEWFVWNHPKFGPRGSGKPYENWDEASGVTINHPGNKAQPFLRPAYAKVAKGGGAMRIAKRVYRRYGLT